MSFRAAAATPGFVGGSTFHAKRPSLRAVIELVETGGAFYAPTHDDITGSHPNHLLGFRVDALHSRTMLAGGGAKILTKAILGVPYYLYYNSSRMGPKTQV